jgi:shikimate kinase
VAECLVLVGMMGSGKSVVGALVARRLGWPFVDVDEAVERRSGRSVAELFAERGETGFRQIESLCLRASLGGDVPAVVAAGGGAVLDPANRELMAADTVVWLRARPETLAARVGDGSGRPLLAQRPEAPSARLAALAAERAPIYAEVADVVVDVDDLDPGELAERVCALIGSGP